MESIGCLSKIGSERNAVVVRFENAAVSEADVEYKWIARINRNVRHATTHHGRSNRARLQIFEKHIG